MFVRGNSFRDVKSYFQERLSVKFSENELKIMLRTLIAERLKISEQNLIGMEDLKFSESDLLYFHNCQKRLAADEPFQYVVGNTWFCDLQLKTDKRALIPRPETEELVAWAIESLKEVKSPKIVDLCSGSGCIALALKRQIPEASIGAFEFSAEAIELIKENLIETKIDISIIEGDALEEATYQMFEDETFDCWISNPPYIPHSDKKLMEQNVLAYEPHIALFVENESPLVFYRAIGKQAMIKLKKGGLLFFEIHEDLAKDVRALLSEQGFVNIELRKDLQGKDRMIKATK